MQNKKLLEDRFGVTALDPDNKTPFRNVSRVHMKSEYGLKVEVDINTNIYPITGKDSFLMKVTACQNIKNVYSHEELTKTSERDNYDYVSYGVIFSLEEKGGEGVVYASFGGLIMRIEGKLDAISSFRKEGVEARILLMIRKA